jgi:hypothetical protein
VAEYNDVVSGYTVWDGKSSNIRLVKSERERSAHQREAYYENKSNP